MQTNKLIIAGLGLALLASVALGATNTYTGTSFKITTTYSDTVNEGDTLTISVTIQNTGTSSISSVTGDVASGDGTTWFTGTASQSFGTISAGASNTKSYSLTASAGGSHTFTVTASGSGVTPETTSQITTHVYSKPSITATATAPSLAYTGGDAITISLTAYNAGELAASSANATLSYSTCTLDPGSPANITLGTINGGSSGSTSWVLRSTNSTGTCTAFANVTYAYGGTSYSSVSTNNTITIQSLLQNITAKSASSGIVGSTLQINGTGFRSEALQFWFNSTQAAISSGNSTANANGSFSTTVIVPNVTGGTKVLRVNTTNDATGNTSTFTVYPKIALSASSGYVGDSVTITGTGFLNESLQLRLNSTSLSIASGSTSGATDGTFSSVVPIPATVKGDYTIRANTTSDATGNTSTFTVSPKITLVSPSSGAVGTSVTITGKGFRGNETLYAYFGTTQAAITAGNTSTADGNASITATVPSSLAYGTYNVLVNSTSDATGYTLSSGYTVPSPATSGTPQGGGGGGAAPSLTTYRNTLASVQPGTPAKLSISDANMTVSEVSIDVKAAATDVTISVTKESSLPSTISIAAPGTVYAYLTISTGNLDASNINSAKVKFTVPKSWVTANGLDVSTITLNRFADGKWNPLPTTQLSSDANNYYFEATTPGFSVFAVKGEKPAVIVPPINQTGNVTGNVTKDCRELNCSSGYECKPVNGTYSCVEKAAQVTPPVAPPVTPPVTPPTKPVAAPDYKVLIVLIVLVVIAGAAAYYYFMMRKPRRPPARPSPAKEQPLTPAQRVAQRAGRK